MFTGLVEDVGTVQSVRPRQRGSELAIRTALPLHDVALGDSIAVHGACLTVDRLEHDRFIAVAGRETLARTVLRDVRPGTRVHLERALAIGDRLGGHLVQGHVDGIATVSRVVDAGESWILWLSLPEDLQRYVAAKGSLCVNGVSLTVNEVDADAVRLNIVPHTMKVTELGALSPTDQVNIEVDILAKYVERLLHRPEPGKGLSLQDLIRTGFAG